MTDNNEKIAVGVGIATQPVKSSNIAAVSHCSERNVLQIQFKNSDVDYQYPDVSDQTYLNLINAKSIGSEINLFVKGRDFVKVQIGCEDGEICNREGCQGTVETDQGRSPGGGWWKIECPECGYHDSESF
jgi:hypothetical protein